MKKTACPTCEAPVPPSRNGRPRYCSKRCSIEAKIDKTSGCWLWTGCTDKMCEIVNGPPPSGKQVLHSCHTPACCNPEHLRWGTVLENQQDASRQGSRKGVLNGRAKLSEQDVDLIRSSSESTADLARRLGVNWTTVDRARKQVGWAHL